MRFIRPIYSVWRDQAGDDVPAEDSDEDDDDADDGSKSDGDGSL